MSFLKVQKSAQGLENKELEQKNGFSWLTCL